MKITAEPGRPTGDGIIYCGNRHESVPRALFLDTRLTPLERNAWQVFRLLLNEDGVTAFPTYAQLSPYLASMPLTDRASDETVARALALLRLTRWLSLVRHRRDPTTGRIQGNLYVLHDEPLTCYEAIQLDPHYLTLVSTALTHAAKAVQKMGHHILEEITRDPLLTDRVLPSRLQLIRQRLSLQSHPLDPLSDIVQPYGDEHDPTTEPAEVLPTARSKPSSESEARQHPLESRPLRNPKRARTVRTDSYIKEVRTVQGPSGTPALRLPSQFQQLRSEQQAAVLVAIARVEPRIQQLVLDEWVARCQSARVRSPAGYLFGLIQRALKGDFRAWAARKEQGMTGPPPEPSIEEYNLPAQSPSENIAAVQIAKLRDMMRLRK